MEGRAMAPDRDNRAGGVPVGEGQPRDHVLAADFGAQVGFGDKLSPEPTSGAARRGWCPDSLRAPRRREQFASLARSGIMARIGREEAGAGKDRRSAPWCAASGWSGGQTTCSGSRNSGSTWSALPATGSRAGSCRVRARQFRACSSGMPSRHRA